MHCATVIFAASCAVWSLQSYTFAFAKDEAICTITSASDHTTIAALTGTAICHAKQSHSVMMLPRHDRMFPLQVCPRPSYPHRPLAPQKAVYWPPAPERKASGYILRTVAWTQ
jgi:hypothetical protein